MDQALQYADEHALPSPLMIMVEDLQTILYLCERNFPMPTVNVGGLRYQPGKIGLSKTVYVSEADVAILRVLEQMGVAITMQALPTDHRTDLYERLQRKWK